jgi:hypothetical protein
MWIHLRLKPRFQRTFFIPCDSHGIQLLIKDIITLDLFKDTMAMCNQIITHFRLAQKQLALLRHYQREIYGKILALTLAGNTRWGSQVGELKSLKRSMDALKRFARDTQNECENAEILEALTDILYWNDVDELLDILLPINEAQIMSESSKGNLSQVYERWGKIRDHLALQEQATSLLNEYDDRVEKQTSDIHLLAFHLNPANVDASYSKDGDIDRIATFMKDHAPTFEAYQAMKLQFVQYKGRRREFASEHLWEKQLVESPLDFWDYAASAGPVLADFAQRLLSTPPNSLPCERSFSCMKLQQNRLRTHLTIDKLDKLCFIHMNRRTLRRKLTDLKRTLHSLDENEEMAAEIVMAVADAEEAHTGVVQRMRATEEAEGDLQPARKRHRRDNVILGPVVGTAAAAKRPRR